MKLQPIVQSVFLLGFSLTGLAHAGDPSVVKSYLLERLTVQKVSTATYKKAAQRYFDLAKAQNFQYAKLANATSRTILLEARAAWRAASPVYESVEGIVAGVEMLAGFDRDLDAGTSATASMDTAVEFDLKLANGKVLAKPGNAFGLGEGTLWGTERSFSSGVKFDVDNNGKIDFCDQLPDAYILQAAAAKLDELTGQLLATAQSWNPNATDVFKAMVANVPTAASVFITRWKTSRFVLGDKSSQRDFNVISSLNDLQQNVSSWQNLYKGVSATVKAKNASLDNEISTGLSSLKTWATKLEAQEKTRRFSLEQAEMIAKEGENRAIAITGRISQAAALVGVKL